MLCRQIRFKLGDEKYALSVSGEAVKSALGNLYEKLINTEEKNVAGNAATEMFLELFGEKITENILLFSEKYPEKAVKKFARIIKKKIYPLAVKQRKYNDRQGVKKYL